MNKKRVLDFIGNFLFASWFFLIGAQFTFLIIDFSLLSFMLYVAEITICVLLIKILNLNLVIWNHEKNRKEK